MSVLDLRPGINQALPEIAEQVTPVPLERPFLIGWSEVLATELGLKAEPERYLSQLNGEGPFPVPATAQVYSGHQFGGYTPRLGDGRGCHIGELGGMELFLKGSGPTPFSRGGDGRAVIRSALREFLASEALHHLGINSSRALAVLGSQTPVYREQVERGAITVRVSRSHLRFGHFEYLKHSDRVALRDRLFEYSLHRDFSHCQGDAPFSAWFMAVVERTATTIADWQAAGFVHGVLNSDNMSILGETFDYGPFAFLNRCDPSYVPNHSDEQGRYAFDQQPGIGWWNLQRLALAFAEHFDDALIQQALSHYETTLVNRYLERMNGRLGLEASNDTQARLDLISGLIQMMTRQQSDFHRGLRQFAHLDPEQEDNPLAQLLSQDPDWQSWWRQYRQQLNFGSLSEWQQQRRYQNPNVVLRTHLAQQAIEAAEKGDMALVKHLHQALCHPYDDHPDFPHFSEAPPSWAQHLPLSCSS